MTFSYRTNRENMIFMVKFIFTFFKEIIKITTQYPVIRGVLMKAILSSRIKKALKQNPITTIQNIKNSGNLRNIITHSILEIVNAEDVNLTIKNINKDTVFFKGVSISKKNDDFKLKIGDNTVNYNLKTKKIHWPDYSAICK